EQVEHETNGGGLAYNWFSPDAKQKLNVYTSLQQVLRQSYYGAGQNPDAYGSTNNLTSVTGAQYVYNFNNSLFMPSELTVGSEYQYDDLHDRMPGYGRDIKQTTRVAGFFLQNEWKNKDMNILLGGRLDKHNLLEKAVFSPRITLKYNFTPNLNWRGSYAAGFRAPQAFEEDLHVDAAGGVMKLIELSDNLRPEYSHSFSTSLDYYFKLGNTEVNLLAEGFHTRINDLFILTETGMSPNGHIIVERQNGSGGQVSGINFEGKIAPSTRLQLQFGYTLQQSLYNEPEQWSDDINVAPERRMLRTPNNYGYFSLSANLTRKLLINATGTYTGSMLAPHFAGYIATDRLETTPQFMDVNLKTTYDFKLNGINLQLSGGVKNIFNSYQKDLDIGPLRDAGYVYGPSIPRTVFVSLKFSNLTF
ncbi:MAG: TonB-dependent receptor, partial [Paludibacter sp.]|nr:TonB-dependent receptor [Paludibacter sp.]